ncbi:alcohol dehydrogenase class-2 isozyme 2 [Ochotona princeps]|uniref:alcohol dehydrogenase class-2 isozyme 2 n=1 Tax=Ochotona princeps TaxID=9978 RepID=UPI00271489C3|nr:alcohol dehydrogenase class-2 isozyme 2 [Ochotona princeps]
MDTKGKVIKCKAAIAWEAGKPLCIEEVEVAPPKAHEVRVKIIAASVCHSDTYGINPALKEAHLPVIIGHECAGIVESVGPGVTNFKPGDKVIPLYLPRCRKCKFCQSPLTNFCTKFSELKTPITEQELMDDKTSRFTCKGKSIYHFLGVSAFSQYTVIKDINLVKIDDDANLQRVFLIGCGFSTGYGAAINDSKVTPGSTCAVFGLGAVGLSAIIGCKTAGASRIIAIDINSDKFAKAKALGATDCLNPKELNKPVQDVIVEMTNGGVDFAIDCAGGSEVMKATVECTTVGWGSCTFAGAGLTDKGLTISPVELIIGRTLRGSSLGGWNVDTISKLVSDYKKGKFDLDALVTHTLPLEKINEALDLLKQGKSIRTLLTY